jgi:hypothetical protein
VAVRAWRAALAHHQVGEGKPKRRFRGLEERLLIRYLWAMPPRPKDKLCKKSPKTRSWRVPLLCRFAAAALIGCIITPPGNALANDSEAEVGIGGLVLRKNAHVEMRSEDLYVSAKEIRVHYRFYNKSGSDVRTIVAFPLPEVTTGDDDERRGLSELKFFTRVNGVSVTTQIEQRALVGGMDRTDVLKRFRIPLDPNASQDALDRLPRDRWDELTKAGLAAPSPTETRLTPLWTLKTTYYWNQTFPAKKEIMIEHRYRPIVGGAVPRDWSGDWSVSEYQKTYCIDREFVRSAKQHKNSSEQWISYILTTGGNWAGPIGEFRLVVDKGDPSNLVSFCADGVKKISPTEFEVRKKNFKPSKDLNVLILRVREAD